MSNISSPIFKSFFQGGFEASTHRRFDGKRLDLINSTEHDKYVIEDYLALENHGIKTVRDGIRWHLIEKRPGYYDWSSFLPMLRASIKTKTQVIWGLCHYGLPDDIDIWKPEFITRFVRFAQAVAKLIKDETDEIPFYLPINEVSFWSWAGGDVAYFNPMARGRGFELKHQLVRATIAAIDSIRLIEPRARFVQAEPLINIFDPILEAPSDRANECQYEAWDMLTGDLWPGLGGRPDLLDIIGINYYPYNQWFEDGTRITPDHPKYYPFQAMLKKVYARYQKPIFIAETGAESDSRIGWLKYVCEEIYNVIKDGVPIEGICLYPILNYPGWDDDRHCETGLLGLAEIRGYRALYEPLAQELKYQYPRFNNDSNISFNSKILAQSFLSSSILSDNIV